MKCYIRNVLLINPAATNGNIDCDLLDVVVRNYPKHEPAPVYFESDDTDERKVIIGLVDRIYISNGCLRGDICFTKDWKFVVTRLVYKPFPIASIAGVINVQKLSYLDNVNFISHASEACSEAISLSNIVGDREIAYWEFNKPECNKEKEPVITFDNEGQDIGSGIMRYGYYKNGALIGYVVVKVTEFGGDDRRLESLDILEKFIEHQRRL